MKREPARYSRLLVLAGLIPLLFLDLFVGLPDGVFVGGGAMIMTVAAVLHFYAGEYHAGAGWLLFGAALGVLAAVDPFAEIIYLVVFVFLLIAGLLLLVSQQAMASTE